MSSATERRQSLKRVWEEARTCRACAALAESRKTVVFGAGNADAELMFVGEAPGRNEDEQGLPFVGQAGKLLNKLLGEIGMDRSEVFIANTLMCRPPGNRNPYPLELENCQRYLYGKIELIQPTMICTLGNFATKLLRGDPTGISRLHGQEEERMIGPRRVRLYPLYHPAAALYTPATLELLRADFLRIPEILRLGPPPQPEPEVVAAQPEVMAGQPEVVAGQPEVGIAEPEPPDATPSDADAGAEATTDAVAEQLGLF